MASLALSKSFNSGTLCLPLFLVFYVRFMNPKANTLRWTIASLE